MLVAGLVIAAALLFSPALEAPLLLDDEDQLAYVQGMTSWRDALGLDCYGLFRPVKNLIFLAVARTPEMPLFGWHILSAGLYLLTALVAFLLLSHLLDSFRWGAVAAIAWTLAPTQVSAVAWLSCANILVMTFCLLVALICYDGARAGGPRPAAAAWLAACTFLYAVAVASYETAVVFPALLVLWDIRARRPSLFTRAAAFHLPVWLVTAAYLGLRFTAHASVMKMGNESFSTLSKTRTFLSAPYFILDHAALWLWPPGRQGVAGTYIWGVSASPRLLAACWLILAALAGLAAGLALRRRAPLVVFGAAWFFVAFFPVSNLVPLQSGPFADYYLVLPSFGLALIVTDVVRRLWARAVREAGAGPARAAARALCTGFIAWRLGLALMCWDWADAWTFPPKLFARSAAARPAQFKAQANLARLFLLAGRIDDARDLAGRAADAAPWYAHARLVLGDIALRTEQPDEARRQFETALRLMPNAPYPLFALGFIAETHEQDTLRAAELYGRVLALPWSASSGTAALNLSRLLALQGRLDDAIRVGEDALARAPNADLHYNLALAYRQKGDEAGAERHRRACEALLKKPVILPGGKR